MSKEHRPELHLCAAAMVAVFSHPMVAKDQQSGVVIHLLRNHADNGIGVLNFTLNLLRLAVITVTSRVNPDYVRDHQFEIAA